MKSLPPRWPVWGLIGLVAVALIVVFVGPTGAGARRSWPTTNVVVRDFWIEMPTPTLRAGTIVLRLSNQGPSTHQINVARTDLSRKSLPLKRDGLTVDEDDPRIQRLASIEQLDLGATQELTLRLQPGRYVLWCNLEGHYLAGMSASIEVVERP